MVTGIGARQRAKGMYMMQIPFKYLNLIIDVDFMVIVSDVLTLLSIRDMVTNGLDIPIQLCHIRFEGSIGQLAMNNSFLIHRRFAEDVPFAL